MKQITLEDVNNTILGTDIKIINYINITNLNDIKDISPHLFGVYVINLKYNESYIGMSKKGTRKNVIRGIKSRLLKHSCENWHKSIIESVDIFITEKHHSFLLEKIMIRKFDPELNHIKYNNFQTVHDQNQLEFDDRYYENTYIEYDEVDALNDDETLNVDYECDPKYNYEHKYGNSKFIGWLEKQHKRNDDIGKLSNVIFYDMKEDVIKFKNIFELLKYIEPIDYQLIDILDSAYKEYKYIHSMNHEKILKNFGIIIIKSLNPELNYELTNNKSFTFNYKIWCKKYDEIETIKNKNIRNILDKEYINKTENNELLNNHKISLSEYKINQQNIIDIRKEKLRKLEKDYSILLIELKDELIKLLQKYEKDCDYICESDYYYKIRDDFTFHIRHKNPELLINNN